MTTRSPDSHELSRTEAIELSTNVMMVTHFVVMVASLVVEVILFGAAGIVIGFGLVLVLAALMAPITLPVSFVIGWTCHRLFSQTNMRVDIAVRTAAILFEVNLLGWILFASLVLM